MTTRIERISMPYKICLNLPHSKKRIFLGKLFCISLDQEKPRFRIPGPGPLEHIQSLANMADLAESLPETLPMRGDLQKLTTRALEAAVADLGDDVKLERVDVTADAG
jgi:hypothetical protein